MTRPGRIACAIPFCRRTAPAEKFPDDEIICGKCWRMADPALRRGNRELYRIVAPTAAQQAEFWSSWDRIKAQITEARGGIA